MPILKNLTFTAVPARSHDPVANHRAKLIERLEEQKALLADTSPVRRPSAGPERATSAGRSRSNSASDRGGVPMRRVA